MSKPITVKQLEKFFEGIRKIKTDSRLKDVIKVHPVGVTCPWCQHGKLTNTPLEYGDPSTVVYCPECSSVYELKSREDLSPEGDRYETDSVHGRGKNK